MAKRSSSKRELIDTGKGQMFGKRDARGQFREMDERGRSAASDRRQRAKNPVKPGYGDQGDRRSSNTNSSHKKK